MSTQSILLFGVLSSVFLAAPVPEPFRSGWGKPEGPDQDCKFRRGGSALTIELPGTDHDYDPVRKRTNAPRLLRVVEGDFVMQVRVRILRKPSGQSTVKGQPSSVAGGFLLIPPKDHDVTGFRFEFGLTRRGMEEDNYAAMRIRGVDKRSAGNQIRLPGWKGWKGDWPLPEKADHALLRLERRLGGFQPFLSADGEKWIPLDGPNGLGGQPAKITIGLAAYSTSTDPAEVRFDHFKLIKQKDR